MNRVLFCAAAILLCLAPFSAQAKGAGKKGGVKAAPGPWMKTPGLYVRFNTTTGVFVCRLFEKESPETVSNFVGLAAAQKEFTDPGDGERKKARFYDGLIFHRVVSDFMIQGGDPLGNSSGGPGYEFEDEVNGLQYDKPGKLAMANSGLNTNGSQFFVTVAPADQLNDRKDPKGKIVSHYTIFGEVVQGQGVVDAISKVETENERPLKPIVMKTVEILRVDARSKMSVVGPKEEKASVDKPAAAPGPGKAEKKKAPKAKGAVKEKKEDGK